MTRAKTKDRRSRGYGGAHQKLRARFQQVIDRAGAYGVPCAKCGLAIRAGDAWDLGHTVDRRAYTGPEHPGCNRADGGRRGGLARRRKSSREW